MGSARVVFRQKIVNLRAVPKDAKDLGRGSSGAAARSISTKGDPGAHAVRVADSFLGYQAAYPIILAAYNNHREYRRVVQLFARC